MVNNFSRKSSRSDGADLASGGRSGATSLQSLGIMLRERREAMGVTLAEVEVATRIRQKYLSAIEAEEWHLLPGEVVGRGFLRNYADYLGIDSQEVMDRRRAATDPSMSNALATTSAGSQLPPERVVDYRPKEVELKDEGDGIQRGEIRLTPILAILAVALVVAGVWWGLTALRAPLGDLFADAQAGVVGLFEQAQPTPTLPGMAVVNEENVNGETAVAGTESATPEGGVVNLGSGGTGAAADSTSSSDNSAGNGSDTNSGNNSGAAATPENVLILVPTDTPASVAVAPTPEPPTPVPPTAEPPTPEPPTPVPPTPEPPTPEPPTPEPPTPEPPAPEVPAVVAAACGDARSVIAAPGVNQVLSGVAGVTGNATHEAFQYYKLEYAPGANAGGGFVYFGGSNVQVSGGVLGNLDTRALPNGAYTLRLTVVDQSGNFPPPCDVSIVIQN
jgi:transcriptional regulator with XRE-family HTH domain